MAQLQPSVIILAVSLIIIGFILVAIGMIQKFKNSENTDDSNHRTSKGLVFIGPIPIVWGFSRGTQIIFFIVALILVICWLLWIL